MKKFKNYREREQHWHQVLETWKTSGETISHYCKSRKIPISCFYQWRKRLKYFQESDSQENPISFIPVEVESEQPTPIVKIKPHQGSVQLNLPNGCWINLEHDFDIQLLNKLMSALEA